MEKTEFLDAAEEARKLRENHARSLLQLQRSLASEKWGSRKAAENHKYCMLLGYRLPLSIAKATMVENSGDEAACATPVKKKKGMLE